MSKQDHSKKKAKLGTITQQLFELGKMPPQAVDLEEAVLGALMLDKDAITTIIEILKPQSFYKEAHNRIFSAIIKLFKRGDPIDILTVTQALKASEELELIGGAYYVTQLTNRVASAANSEFHARIIAQKYMQRELIRTSTLVIQKAYADETDVFDLLDEAQSCLHEVVLTNIKSREKNTTEIMGELIAHMEKATLSTQQFTGVPSNISELNTLTRGWQGGDLIVIAGRPGMGKTAFTKNCIKGAIDYTKRPVHMFSIEMPTLQISARLMSEDVGVPSKNLLDGKFENGTNFNAINAAVKKYYDDNYKDLLFIDDSAMISINELRAKAKRVHAQHDTSLIIVDYLQKVKGNISGANNRVAEVEEVTWGLKALAKELNVPVIALSQLSRAVDQERERKPSLSHLRESGAIEQDADLVGFLYRPEYYAKHGDSFLSVEVRGQVYSSENYGELIIEKHRNGALGVIPMTFVGHLTQFKDWTGGPSMGTNSAGHFLKQEPTPPVIPPEQGDESGKIQPNNNFFKEGDKNKFNEEEEPPF